MSTAEFSAVFLLGRCHKGVVLGSVEEILRKSSRNLGEVLGRPAESFDYIQELYESGTRMVREWYESGTKVVGEWYDSGTRVVRE